LPGLFFLLILGMGIPDGMTRVVSLGLGASGNVMDSAGRGVAVVAVSYLLGWVFLSFTWCSKQEPMRKKHQESGDSEPLYTKYQRIRLSHPAAGFRIVKLRAEARVLETSRTAMIAVILISILYVEYMVVASLIWGKSVLGQMDWIRVLVGLVVAVVLCVGLYLREEKAWDSYWENIRSIYNLLHGTHDPDKVMDIDGKMAEGRRTRRRRRTADDEGGRA